MAIKKKFPALGRGLDALISTEEVVTSGSSSISEINIDQIYPNPDQPRKDFDPEALAELAESIKNIGIIQPVTLRQKADDKYEIIAGERRWQAAKIAGLTTMPAYVRTVSDEDVMEMALIENIQREDLNPMEIAMAYNNLIERTGATQEQVADKVGKKRATVANYLRLLKLSAPIQMALSKGEIDQGHARLLVSITNPDMQLKIFHEAQKENYSVRKLEEIIQNLNSGKTTKVGEKRVTTTRKTSNEYDALKKHLSTVFNTKVQITSSTNGKGRISIPFNSEKDLEKIIAQLDKMNG